MMPTVLPCRAHVARVGVDQRRLAGARRPGEAHHQGMAQVRLHGLQQARRGGRQSLQLRDGTRDGAPLARAHALDERRDVCQIVPLGFAS